MTTLSAVVTAALLQSLWQDAVVAGALLVVLAALRGCSPQARYIAASVALAAMAALPIVTAASAWWRAVDVVSFGSPLTIGQDITAAWLTVHREAPLAAGGSPMVPLATWQELFQGWAFPLWIAGMALCSLRLLGSGLHTRSVSRRSMAADDALQALVSRMVTAMRIPRDVTIELTPAIDGAATLGWLRPVILLAPATAAGLTSQQLEAVIAHELAHIRRHDYLVNVLQLVAETVFFYHPAVWWVSHRMRVERELCCDDAAVEACGDARVYARALAVMAAVPQPALGASGGSLRARIERLLGVVPPPRTLSPRAGLVALMVAAAVAIGGAAWVHAQQPPSTASSSAEAGSAVLSGTVVDPLGNPAANTPITLIGRGIDIVQPSSTDAAGRYRFERLPAGTYSVRTPITDSILPISITLAADEQRAVTIDLGVDDVAVDIRVCADCSGPSAPDVPSAAAAPGIPDRPAIVGAEPAEGWEAFNAKPHAYPPALKEIGIEGTVLVEARVTAEGRVAGARAAGMNLSFDVPHRRALRTTCPDGACMSELSAAAVALAEQLRWRPAMVHGTPVDVPLHLTVEYTLAGN